MLASLPLGLDASPIEGQAQMRWSLPHKLVAAWMRILLNFWLAVSLSARQHHACFQICNRNSGCRCLCKSLGRLLCTNPYPPLGASEVSGESWLFMIKMMIWCIVSDTDIAYDGVHSRCLSFGFAGTDTMVTLNVLLWSFLCNLIDVHYQTFGKHYYSARWT
jgi:hypothetical protein